jgi:hypothetical protein
MRFSLWLVVEFFCRQFCARFPSTRLYIPSIYFLSKDIKNVFASPLFIIMYVVVFALTDIKNSMKMTQMAVKILYQLFCVIFNTALSFLYIFLLLPHAVHASNTLLTHADNFLCLQLHTVQSPYTVHASNTC